MQSERNYGRAVYRSKNEVNWDLRGSQHRRGYIYLYSFNAEEYAGDEHYERIKRHSGVWLVSFMKSTKIIKLVIIDLLR